MAIFSCFRVQKARFLEHLTQLDLLIHSSSGQKNEMVDFYPPLLGAVKF